MIHRLLKRRVHDESHEVIWLTIYADLITNLMLVFLTLYGLALMGDEAMVKALQSMKLNEITSPVDSSTSLEFDQIIPLIKDEFKSIPDITVVDDVGAGLARIEFGEKVLFESGGAEIKSSGINALLQLASILVTVPYTIVVEGYTDNVPLLPGSHYKDNRELSLARAMSVVRLLSDQGALPVDQMAAAAYGEYKPRSSNLTSAGRQMNRRVDILLVKDFPYGKTNAEPAKNP